jgi:hypothetical protein
MRLTGTGNASLAMVSAWSAEKAGEGGLLRKDAVQSAGGSSHVWPHGDQGGLGTQGDDETNRKRVRAGYAGS